MDQLLQQIDEAQRIIQQIRMNPDFQRINYSPDITMADVSMGLSLLKWELEDMKQYPARVVNLSGLEAFSQ